MSGNFLEREHGVQAKWVQKIGVKIEFIVVQSCASYNVFFATHRFVHVVIASNAMIDEQGNYFESAPRSNV